ncbi:MAG: PQQ-binding-like beta-propeller repeat protein [Planctomycetota bacterium]
MASVHRTLLIAVGLLVLPSTVQARHRVLLQGNGRLAVIEPDGAIGWSMKWGSIHDLHLLPNGRILTRQGRASVVEIDMETQEIVWRYDSAASHEQSGKKVEVHAFERLSDGATMIAESGIGRLIEVTASGSVRNQIPLTLHHPSVHSDTRLVRSTPSGTYLVAHEADGCVREYDRSGTVLWEFEVPLFGRPPAKGHGPEAFGNRLFCAIELENGNRLIATGNGHSILEVTPNKEIVWQVHQNELPNIRFAWVTTLQILDNGHLVIGNCHAGPGQPILVELDRATKEVVWTLDRYEDFGNNVSNAIVIDDYQRTMAVPQANPAPKPQSNSKSPR